MQDDKQAERAALAHKQGDFLDGIMDKADIKNDAQLSRLIKMTPPVVSKIRNGHMAVGPAILIAINEVTGIPVAEMKTTLGYAVLKPRQKI